MPTMSCTKGKKGFTSLKHNDRTIKNRSEFRSWDPELTYLNHVYVNTPLRETYKRVFGEALKEYNARHYPGRRIHDYLDHIERSKEQRPYFEFIIGLSNIEDTPRFSEAEAVHVQCLDEYMKDWQARNPNLIITQAILHMDEPGSAPHIHLDVVPVSYNSTRGMKVRNSFSKAMEEMGFSVPVEVADGKGGTVTRQMPKFPAWREREMDVMREILKAHGLELTPGDGRTEHLDTPTYKAFTAAKKMEKQNAADRAAIEEERKALDTLKEETENDLIAAQNDAWYYRQAIEARKDEKAKITQEVTDLQDRHAVLEQKLQDEQGQLEAVQRKTAEAREIIRQAPDEPEFPELPPARAGLCRLSDVKAVFEKWQGMAREAFRLVKAARIVLKENESFKDFKDTIRDLKNELRGVRSGLERAVADRDDYREECLRAKKRLEELQEQMDEQKEDAGRRLDNAEHTLLKALDVIADHDLLDTLKDSGLDEDDKEYLNLYEKNSAAAREPEPDYDYTMLYF